MMKITDEKAEDVNLSTIKVVKRDGRLVTFDDQKIYDALITSKSPIDCCRCQSRNCRTFYQ